MSTGAIRKPAAFQPMCQSADAYVNEEDPVCLLCKDVGDPDRDAGDLSQLLNLLEAISFG